MAAWIQHTVPSSLKEHLQMRWYRPGMFVVQNKRLTTEEERQTNKQTKKRQTNERQNKQKNRQNQQTYRQHQRKRHSQQTHSCKHIMRCSWNIWNLSWRHWTSSSWKNFSSNEAKCPKFVFFTPTGTSIHPKRRRIETTLHLLNQSLLRSEDTPAARAAARYTRKCSSVSYFRSSRWPGCRSGTDGMRSEVSSRSPENDGESDMCLSSGPVVIVLSASVLAFLAFVRSVWAWAGWGSESVVRLRISQTVKD